MKKIVIVFLLFLVSSLGFAARKALVVGNSNYSDRPLKNPTNDATLMKSTLEGIGFDVTILTNADRLKFDRGVSDFARSILGDDEVLFFYSGHGIQLEGENYLLPIDEFFEDNPDVTNKAIKLKWVIEKLSRAKLTLIFLDACRDNPFLATKSISLTRGLAMEIGKSQSFAMYSTGPGETASDGAGNYSDFCLSLSMNMQIPGLSIDEISANVTREVVTATNRIQNPERKSNLMQAFYFVEPKAPQSPAYNPPPPVVTPPPITDPPIVPELPDKPINVVTTTPGSEKPGLFEPSNSGGSTKSKSDEPPIFRPQTKTPSYPAITKYLSFLTANEYSSLSQDQDSQVQLLSKNRLGLHLLWIGISAEYTLLNLVCGDTFGSDEDYQVTQTGVGFGMPNPELLRLYGSFYHNQLTSPYQSDSYQSLLAEFCKRVSNENQFSELSASYRWNRLPDEYDPYDSYIPMHLGTINSGLLSAVPNSTISIQAYTSSIANRYQEPLEDMGIAPDTRPLMLLNKSGFALKLKVQFDTFNLPYYDDHETHISIGLPVNFSKTVGVDFGFERFLFSRTLIDGYEHHTWLDTSDFSANIYSGTMRLALINSNSFKLVPCVDYYRLESKEKDTNYQNSTDYLHGSLYVLLKLGNHILANAFLTSRNTWMLESNPFDFEDSSLILGTGITLRL